MCQDYIKYPSVKLQLVLTVSSQLPVEWDTPLDTLKGEPFEWRAKEIEISQEAGHRQIRG